MKEERKTKSLIDKYRVINPKGYLEIEETVNRVHGNPNQLQLYGIYDDGELIYKEAVPDNTNVRLKIAGLKKYCFNHNSFLQNWFFMNEQTRYLIFFRKFTFCRHKFSCFEHILRTVYRTVGFYLIVRLTAKALFREKIFELFGSALRKWFYADASDKFIADAGMAIEANALIGVNLYVLRNCFYSFILEFLAD